jgi:hypothetical protein
MMTPAIVGWTPALGDADPNQRAGRHVSQGPTHAQGLQYQDRRDAQAGHREALPR